MRGTSDSFPPPSSGHGSWRCCPTSRDTASKLRWRPVVLGALGYLGIALASPLALVALPLTLVLVAVPLAVYLLTQRPARRDVVVGVVLAVLAWTFLAGPGDPLASLERAWAALVAGALAVLMLDRPGRPFVPAALAALGLATGAAALLVWVTPLTWGEVAWRVGREFNFQSRLIVGQLSAVADAAGGETSSLIATMERSLEAGIRLSSAVFPALLLLQSFAALALGWTLYQRVARTPLGVPLGRLRTFRFDDNLIWGVVLALVALLIPRLAGLGTLGGNLAVFFGGLYALRGFAVAAAMAATAGIDGVLAAAGATLVLLFLAPVAAMAALALGLTDTWVDWRRRLERAAGPR